MNIKMIPMYAKTTWAGAKFYAHKYSAEIYLGSSIATGIACTVTTGIAATKLPDVLIEHKKEAEAVRRIAADDPDFDEGKAMTKVFYGTGKKICRLFLVPALLGSASIGFSLKSHSVMKETNVALAGIAAAAEKKLEEYRKNTVERYGEDVDQELAGEVIKKKVLKEVVDPETEQTKIVEETETKFTGYSKWARFFGRGSAGWSDPVCAGPGANITYMDLMENSLNAQCHYNRYIAMNTIYDRMRYPLVADGWDWGIIWDPNGPEKQINFGFRRKGNINGTQFLNGETDEVWWDVSNVQYIRNKVLPSTQAVFEDLVKHNAARDASRFFAKKEEGGALDA